MKICDSCGHPNFDYLKDEKHNRICLKCTRIIEKWWPVPNNSGQGRPYRLLPLVGDGNSVTQPIDAEAQEAYLKFTQGRAND